MASSSPSSLPLLPLLPLPPLPLLLLWLCLSWLRLCLLGRCANPSSHRYVAGSKAWELGFVGLWEYLGRWIDSTDRRWSICARVKGGLRDTAKPGGFCRDQAYWAGAVQVVASYAPSRSAASHSFQPLGLSARTSHV